MPFKGSLLVKSGDAKNLKKPLVSLASLFPNHMFGFVIDLCAVSAPISPPVSAFLEQEINRSLTPPLQAPLPPPCPTPLAPQPLELITIEEESERLARELKEVGPPINRAADSVIFTSPNWLERYLTLSNVGPSDQVSRNRDSLQAQLTQLCQYRGVLTRTHSITASQVPQTRSFLHPFHPTIGGMDRESMKGSFLAGAAPTCP